MEGESSSRPLVAVDLDEVLGSFVRALNKFHGANFGTSLRESDYFSYHFSDVWGCSDEEASARVSAFFGSEEFKAIAPVPGSQEGLRAASRSVRFVVVTSRQNVLQEATKQWIETHFPHIFEGVHFGNHYASDGSPSRSKAEICKELGAVALIDDSRHHAVTAAKAGVPVVILFGDYAWNKPSLGAAPESKGATPKPAGSAASSASASGAGTEGEDTLVSGIDSVHQCPDWKFVRSVLERLTPSGELAPVPSLWVKGGPSDAAAYTARAGAVMQRQEELDCTAVGVSITPLLAVVETLTRDGLATIVSTTSGLDAAFGGKPERMPRLTVKLQRTPALREQAAERERQVAMQTDAVTIVAVESARKAVATAKATTEAASAATTA